MFKMAFTHKKNLPIFFLLFCTLDTRNPGRPGLQSVPASDSISRRRTVLTLWVSVDLADGTVGKPWMSLVTGCNFMMIGHRVGVDHGHMVCGTPRPPCRTTATATGDTLDLGWDRPMRIPMPHDPINLHHVPQGQWWLGRYRCREVCWVVSWCHVHVLLHVVFCIPLEAWCSGSHVGDCLLAWCLMWCKDMGRPWSRVVMNSVATSGAVWHCM